MSELLSRAAEVNTYRKAANYWWANYYAVQGKQPPVPTSSDPEQDQALQEMIDLHAVNASQAAEISWLRAKLAEAERRLAKAIPFVEAFILDMESELDREYEHTESQKSFRQQIADAQKWVSHAQGVKQ